jgi:soluble lytic murein transglycosylase-like protein
MQLMPATARLRNVARWYEPKQNVEGGVSHLRYLLNRYGGNVRLAVAAYNAGEGAVDRHGGVPPFPETQEYLSRVLRFRDLYLTQQ